MKKSYKLITLKLTMDRLRVQITTVIYDEFISRRDISIFLEYSGDKKIILLLLIPIIAMSRLKGCSV